MRNKIRGLFIDMDKTIVEFKKGIALYVTKQIFKEI